MLLVTVSKVFCGDYAWSHREGFFRLGVLSDLIECARGINYFYFYFELESLTETGMCAEEWRFKYG